MIKFDVCLSKSMNVHAPLSLVEFNYSCDVFYDTLAKSCGESAKES